MEESRPDFNGKWQVIESENFEEFLRATGAPWIVRKMVGNMKPMTEIKQIGDTFQMKVCLLMFSREECFEIGVEFEVKQPDGSMNCGKAEWDDYKLVIDYQPVDGVNEGQQIVRELLGEDRMQTTMTSAGVTAKRISKRLEAS